MKLLASTLAGLALALLQAAPADAPAPAREPFAGTLVEGLAELERLVAAGSIQEAHALAEDLLAPTDFLRWRAELRRSGSRVLEPLLERLEPLLELLGLAGLSEPLRAEVHFAQGLAHLAGGESSSAEAAFGRARALAGPGELRLEAMYNRGLTVLLAAEAWRARIPELGGTPPAPAAPLPGGSPPAEEPDPLREARNAYLGARERLVERLRADWRDADTRANVELVQRRLAELDEIERQREEQQEQQEQQDQSREQSGGEEESDESKEGDGSQQEEERESEEGSEGEEKSGAPPDAPEPQAEEDRKESEGEEQQTGQEEGGEEEPQSEQSSPAQEVHLTREEVLRLLERLRQHEEEGTAVQRRLQQSARRGTSRDW